MTISDRVLAYLKEQPGSVLEIVKALNIKRRHTRMGYTYYWGNWSFVRAEIAGLIEFKDHPGGGKWHLKEEEPHLGFVYDDGFLLSWKLTPVKTKGEKE